MARRLEAVLTRWLPAHRRVVLFATAWVFLLAAHTRLAFDDLRRFFLWLADVIDVADVSMVTCSVFALAALALAAAALADERLTRASLHLGWVASAVAWAAIVTTASSTPRNLVLSVTTIAALRAAAVLGFVVPALVATSAPGPTLAFAARRWLLGWLAAVVALIGLRWCFGASEAPLFALTVLLGLALVGWSRTPSAALAMVLAVTAAALAGAGNDALFKLSSYPSAVNEALANGLIARTPEVVAVHAVAMHVSLRTDARPGLALRALPYVAVALAFASITWVALDTEKAEHPHDGGETCISFGLYGF